MLRKVYSYMEAAAVPGIALPLLQDDCVDTAVDLDWVWDYLHLTSEDKTRRMNLNALHEEVRGWFTTETLEELMGTPEGDAEKIARDWLVRDGKRWRPFLTIATYQALRDDPEGPISARNSPVGTSRPFRPARPTRTGSVRSGRARARSATVRRSED